MAYGKGPSIWDEFCLRKGAVARGETGNTACDFYHRYPSDLDLLHQLGIKHLRLSLSWARLLPNGIGKVNHQGVAFYSELFEQCRSLGITPWVTLYHWDLPLALQRRGGWANREVVHWFEEYASVCAHFFGSEVKHWMVLNEPMVFTGAGYFFGLHAPGIRSLPQFMAAVHHAVLCQSAGGRVLRSTVPDACIGTTVSCAHVDPASDRKWHRTAATKVDALLNRLFVEPALGLGYPTDALGALRALYKYVLPGDEQRMAFDFDFWGIQCYTREVVSHSLFTPIVRAKLVPAHKRGGPITAMNWEVHPPALRLVLAKFAAYEGVRSLIVTENGAAFHDEPAAGLVNDPQRIAYLRDHVDQLKLAAAASPKVKGYFVWTLLDNFEWAEGYRPRFGLVHVDHHTQQRTLKASALWYSELIAVKIPLRKRHLW